MARTQHQSSQTSRDAPQSRPVFRPAVDIVESADGVTLTVELPGVDERSLDVTVDKDVLSIRGRVDPPVVGNLAPARREYEIGDYERSFTISKDLDRENIDASFRNGVLTLKLARRQSVGPHKVAVKSG